MLYNADRQRHEDLFGIAHENSICYRSSFAGSAFDGDKVEKRYHSLCLFLAGFVIIGLFKIKEVPKWVILVVTISPIIVFFAYMLINYVNPDTLDVVVGDDPSKTMGSRAKVWGRVMSNFVDSFAFGDYGEFSYQQMHNSFATIFCRYGFAFVASSAWFMYDAACRVQKKLSVYAALSLCAVYVSGCFETSLFGGISGLYLMFFLLPICNRAEERNEVVNAEQ